MSSDQTYLVVVKAVSMLIMFIMIMILGNLPLRWQQFRNSTKLISLASGFSGGLFLAVGILHLLPEAREAFDDYYASQGIEETDDEFPWSNFICVICFAFVLFLEKVAFASYMTHDHEGEGLHNNDELGGHVHLPAGLKHKIHQSSNYFLAPLELLEGPDFKTQQLLPEQQAIQLNPTVDEKEDEFQQEAQTKATPLFQLAQRVSVSVRHSHDDGEQKFSKMTPYILQVAIGIHAIFEGMAIGLETDFTACIGIALAVVCHKWAEGLTLGIAFFKADVELKMATIMITIQAIMNPVGIMIGWLLSNQGDMIRGIFESVSAGTFLYIASAEVIVNEFNLKRNRFLKFTLFMIAIAFVTSLFFIEQATGA